MSKKYNTAENQRSIDEIRQKREEFITNRYKPLLEEVYRFVCELSDDEDIAKLNDYVRYTMGNTGKIKLDINMKRIKAFILLLSEFSDSHDVDKILSFLESVGYGWRGDKYILNNDCLRVRLHHTDHCKKISKISDIEVAKYIITDIYNLFFDKEYGEITLFIFCYCLAALFSGKLAQDRFAVPFFLQIACNRDSVLYKLIQEIVEICDVNSGLFSKCNNNAPLSYRYCGYTHQIYYPTQFTAGDLDYLISNQDIPVIIDGHENERYYNALLREVANIPNKKKPLDMRDRFNILPIFICPAIKSSFNNVFDMSISDLDVSTNYLSLLRNNKQMLASWVLELVTSFDSYLFPHMMEDDKQRQHPFFSVIGAYVNYISQKFSYLTLENAKNVGCLNFFFKGFMQVIQRSFSFPIDKKFDCFLSSNGEPLLKNGEETIALLTEKSETSLVKMHRRYLPAPKSMGIKNESAIQLAKQIEKHYRALKVFIRLTPAVVKGDRYIFNVDTLQETKDTDIGRNAATVQRRLKNYECFRADLSDPKMIKIVVAEKALEDNNLINILQHKDFAETKMKIPYAIGYDDMGKMCIEDIWEFPHLLLAGATRSGKSTAMMCLLMSIAYKHRSGNVNVLILDLLGKAESDFEVFNNQPILSCPVITSAKIASKLIMKLDEVRENRLKDKNLSEMPYIVCIIDEFPRLFSDIDDKEETSKLEGAMTRLLSGGRHAKIHLILAAQDPTKKHMVCGIGNIAARIALRCSHYQRSIVILGRSGAEKLLGKGQMIFDCPTENDKRLQGAYIPIVDVTKQLDDIKETFKQVNEYPFSISEAGLELNPIESSNEKHNNMKTSKSDDELLLARSIIRLLGEDTFASTLIEDEFHIGYRRAKPIMGILEELGLITEKYVNIARVVIPKCIEDLPAEVTELLAKHGYTEDDIKNAFSKRLSKAAVMKPTRIQARSMRKSHTEG